MKNDKMTKNAATVQGRAGLQKESTKTECSNSMFQVLCE